MIELTEVTKFYSTGTTRTLALQNINLRIETGEIFGVIGPSGAGKSSLIRCVNLLERPDSGRVVVNGQNLTTLNKNGLRLARRKIGMIFQHFNLLASRTVYQNIALPLELAGYKGDATYKTIMPLLELTELLDKKDDYPSQLSGGQKQRVAIARALAGQPEVLLSDEATSSLDPSTTHSILQLLKDINKKLGVTILLITHDMDVVKEACHRLAIIEKGQIIEQSEVIDFFSNPKSKIAKQFIRNKLKHHLPKSLQQRLLTQQTEHAVPLLRVSFIGSAAQQPIVAELSQRFSLRPNILQAHIEEIHDQMVGVMILEITGNTEQLQAGIDYFTEKGVLFEVIGYVERNS